MVSQHTQVTVIGLGSRHRGDDAVGLDVARRVSGCVPKDVRVIEATGDGLALLDAWGNCAVTYVVDAAQSGAPPGTVHRIENDCRCLPKDMVRCSSHAFGLVEALELGRALGRTPPQLVIYAIEGQCFDAGKAMSPEVSTAASIVTQRLLAEIAGRSFE